MRHLEDESDDSNIYMEALVLMIMDGGYLRWAKTRCERVCTHFELGRWEKKVFANADRKFSDLYFIDSLISVYSGADYEAHMNRAVFESVLSRLEGK